MWVLAAATLLSGFAVVVMARQRNAGAVPPAAPEAAATSDSARTISMAPRLSSSGSRAAGAIAGSVRPSRPTDDTADLFGVLDDQAACDSDPMASYIASLPLDEPPGWDLSDADAFLFSDDRRQLLAKICPECGSRYRAEYSTCTRDDVELSALN